MGSTSLLWLKRNMRYRLKWYAAALAAFLFAGCFVQSFHPYYTKTAICTIPGIEGEWTPIDKKSDGKPLRPWVIRGDRIMTYDENGAPGLLKVVYFRAGESFFIDTIAETPPEGAVNEWWTMHLLPLHIVTRVDMSDNGLTLTPIDFDYMGKALEKGEVRLTYIKRKDDDSVLFTASPEEWIEFLKKYGKDKLVFSDKNAVRLVKRAAQGG